jgi:dolichyl-phosphate-mannose-protein mannosyltransferase
VVDVYARKLGSRMHSLIILSLIAMNLAIYFYFMPLAFGFTGPAKDYGGRRWSNRWNIHDVPDEVLNDGDS